MKTKAIFYTSRGGLHRGRLISGRSSRGFLGLSLSAIFAVLATIPAFATDPDPELVAAQKTVASKAYVDTKQNIIPVQSMTIGTGNTAFTAPLSLVAYPTQTAGVIGQLAVLNENAFTNYITANNIDPNGMSASEGLGFLGNMMMNVMPDSVPTSSLVGGMFGLFDEVVSQTFNVKIPASGQYDISGTNPYTNGNGTTNTDWLNAYVKGTGIATRTNHTGVIGERKIFESTDVANYHATGLTQNQKDIQDISIPTVGAMMDVLLHHVPTGTANTIANYDANGDLGSGIATLSWTATETTATQGYSTTFSDTSNNGSSGGPTKPIDGSSTTSNGNSGNWPTADANKLVNGTALANGLALKQNIIPVQTMTIGTGNTAFTAPLSLVAYPTQTAGVIGQLAVLNENAFANYIRVNNINTNNMSPDDVVSMAVELMRVVMPDSVPTSELVGDLTVILDDAKQNKIPVQSMTIGTGNTAFTAPLSLVAYPTQTAGVIGQTAILDETALTNYATANNITITGNNAFETLETLMGSVMPDSVPTSGMVAEMVHGLSVEIGNNILSWTSAETAAVNTYSTTFDASSTHTAGNWLYQTNDQLISTAALANSLALKQNIIPAGTAGNVVTYTGTAGSVGSVATANAPTYNSTTGALENGTSIATIAAVDTRQKKMTCAGYEPGHENTPGYCWLWTLSAE